ncbi:reverse transcriptase domain-containing protein [Tanacetum coccineum]
MPSLDFTASAELGSKPKPRRNNKHQWSLHVSKVLLEKNVYKGKIATKIELTLEDKHNKVFSNDVTVKMEILLEPTSNKLLVGLDDDKMYLKHHEKQVEDILNYLDELYLYRIERMEEGRINESLPKNIQHLQHQQYSGNADPSTDCSHCAEENKVTYATGTLTDDALSWWNSHAQPIRIDQANQITWTELKRLLTNKYCPRTEVKKMEDEFYNLAVKGNDLKNYIRRIQVLAVIMPKPVRNSEKLMKSHHWINPEYKMKMQSVSSLKLWRKPSTYPRERTLCESVLKRYNKANEKAELETRLLLYTVGLSAAQENNSRGYSTLIRIFFNLKIPIIKLQSLSFVTYSRILLRDT